MDRPSYSSAGMRGSAAHSLMIQSSSLKPSSHSSLQMHGSGVTGSSMRPRSATSLQPSAAASGSPVIGASSINQMLQASSLALSTAGVGLQGTAMSRQSRTAAPASSTSLDWSSSTSTTQTRSAINSSVGTGGAVPVVTPGSLLGTHKAFTSAPSSNSFQQPSSLQIAASTIPSSSPSTVPVTISTISPFAAYSTTPTAAIANAAANSPTSNLSTPFSALSVSTNQPFTTSVSAHPNGVPHSSSASSGHPNESLIRQIEEQWNDYSRAIAAEQTKGGAPSSPAGGAPIIPGGAGSVSSLALLLNKLQSNQLWNFFEFTNHRQVLTIYGPSFDCLYYNPPPSLSNLSPLSPPVSTIYRDKHDYTNTLANIQYLTFKYVDFQLIALQLPLIKQKCTKLKSISFQANNIHSLFQLDLIALFAPVPTTTAASNMYHSNLDQVTLVQNIVTESPLYRSYLISILCMNCFVPKDTSSVLLSPRSARGGGSSKDSSKSTGFLATVTPTNAIAPSILDGRRISDEEIWESFECFSEMHRKKYYLNPVPNTGAAHTITNSPSHVPVVASSYWMDLLCELSLSNHGGPVALGTAANPLLSFPTSTASPSPAISAIPLPLRPVNASSTNRRAAKKFLEECCTRALATSARAREFEQEWAEVVHGSSDNSSGNAVGGLSSSRGSSTARLNTQGLIPSEILRLQKSGISLHSRPLAGSPADPLSFLSGPINTPSSNLHSSNSAAALHRVTYDKTRIMKAYNNSANPTAVLGAMGAPAPAPVRRKKSAPIAN